MHKIAKKFLRNYIEKNYDVWGIEIITKLPPEFVITEHAYTRMKDNLNIKKEKMSKIMLKAWHSHEHVDEGYIIRSKVKYGPGIYKMFNGIIFIFKEKRRARLGVPQKYLITAFIYKGWQYH